VKRRTYVDRDAFNSRAILNVKNGLLNLETLQFQPHTPDYLSTAQIGVIYNPDAKARAITKFLREVAQPQDIALIEEIIGWLLSPDYNVHKAVMFLGPGRNGKGTLMRLITAFLGKKSVSNVTLQDLVADRFSKADLYGKLANIGGDLPSKDLSDTAAFRNLTGGDDNRAQEKYRPAFSFRNKAKLMFSANVLPRSSDDTYAFYSRWILIEFLKVFDLQKGTADPDLDAKLQTEKELSGLLNLALSGLARLRANGWKFSYSKTVEDVEIMYKRNANPVYAFLLDECEPGDATDYIEKTLFYNRFKEYASKHGIRPLSSTKFSELLKDQAEIPVSTFRPYIEHGDRPWCWQGVRFKDRANECQSRLSRVSPTPSSRKDENAKEDGEDDNRESRDKKNPGQPGPNGEIEANLRQAEEQAREKEEHFKEVVERFASGHRGALQPSQGNYKLQSELQNETLGQDESEAPGKAVTSSLPAGFTEEEHSRMLRAVERLRHKRYPLMIKSNYGASLISESGLTSDRIRPWLLAIEFRPRILGQSGLEIWEEGEGEKEEISCGSCPVALKGDKSVIRCDPCSYLASVEVQRNSLREMETAASPQRAKASL